MYRYMYCYNDTKKTVTYSIGPLYCANIGLAYLNTDWQGVLPPV